MNKETVETAAENYRLETFESKVGLNHANAYVASIKDAFEKGAQWQEQQSANEAIAFAEWLCENGWASSPPMWVNGEASDDYIGGKGTYTELTSKELYNIWQQTKKQ